jgi:putative membrane protein
MAIADNDPRVFFAAERTLLAWLRTGLTVMALGFVIARFGLFLQYVAPASAARPHAWSSLSAMLGIAFVLAGALASLLATLQHRRFVATLPLADLPSSYPGHFAAAFGFFMSCAGLVLAVYLGVSES